MAFHYSIIKKEYIIDYLYNGGNGSSFCKSIFVVPEKIDEILERDEIIVDSIVLSTIEVPGNVFEDTREIIKKKKEIRNDTLSYLHSQIISYICTSTIIQL